MSLDRQKNTASAIDAAVQEDRKAFRLALVRAVGRIAREYHDRPEALEALDFVQAAVDDCYKGHGEEAT